MIICTPSTDSDDLAPARGMVNGMIFGALMWLMIGATVALWGCR